MGWIEELPDGLGGDKEAWVLLAQLQQNLASRATTTLTAALSDVEDGMNSKGCATENGY